MGDFPKFGDMCTIVVLESQYAKIVLSSAFDVYMTIVVCDWCHSRGLIVVGDIGCVLCDILSVRLNSEGRWYLKFITS